MASYNINTSTAREAALSAKVAAVNARRAAQTPPLGAITNAQALQVFVNRTLDAYADQQQRDTLILAHTAAERNLLGLAPSVETDTGA